jgi:hypothetical protein
MISHQITQNCVPSIDLKFCYEEIRLKVMQRSFEDF